MSYGKLFDSTFTGSMVGSGACVFAVWAYVVANARQSYVELNQVILSALLGATTQDVSAAIEFLCAPDPDSRNKKHEGRRLIREGQFLYFVTGHELYRGMRDDDERREYFRVKQREHREKIKSGVKPPVKYVNRSQPQSTYTEAEALKEKLPTDPINLGLTMEPNSKVICTGSDKGNGLSEPRIKKFIKPSLVEIKEYCCERRNNVDALAFLDHYDANGWKVGKVAMKDWKAAVRTWERQNHNHGTETRQRLPRGI